MIQKRNDIKINTGSGALDCDPRHRPPRGERGRRLPDGGGGRPGQEALSIDKKRKKPPQCAISL